MVIRGECERVFERGKWGWVGDEREIGRECVVILRVRFVVLKVSWGEKVDKYREIGILGGGVCEFGSKVEGGVFVAFANWESFSIT
mgnify:CR=1 FL=1